MGYYWYEGRRSIGDGFKLWAGDGSRQVPSVNRRLATLLYMLFEDSETLVAIPKDGYPHTTPISHDQSLVDDPFGFVFETVRCLAHQSRENLGFQALKHVTVKRDGKTETELLKTPRSYLFLWEGRPNMERVYVRISQATFEVAQTAGLIAQGFSWERSSWFPLEFASLHAVSTNWARPYALGLGFVAREIAEMKALLKVLSVMRRDRGIEMTPKDIYLPDSQPVDGPREAYTARHVRYNLVQDRVVPPPIGEMSPENLLAEIDRTQDRLRWLVWIEALIRGACEIMYRKHGGTAPLTFNWGDPLTVDTFTVQQGALRNVYGRAAYGVPLIPTLGEEAYYWRFERQEWTTQEVRSKTS
jgi:hypothetical protein